MTRTTIGPSLRLATLLVLATSSSLAAAAAAQPTPAADYEQQQQQAAPIAAVAVHVAGAATDAACLSADCADPDGTTPADDAMTGAPMLPRLGLPALLGMEPTDAGC